MTTPQMGVTHISNKLTPLGLISDGSLIYNTSSTDSVYVGPDTSVSSTTGMRIGPLGSITWVGTHQVYAVATGDVDVIISGNLNNPSNPLDVAEALVDQGIPSKLVTNVVIPTFTKNDSGFAMYATVDVSDYSLAIISILANNGTPSSPLIITQYTNYGTPNQDAIQQNNFPPGVYFLPLYCETLFFGYPITSDYVVAVTLTNRNPIENNSSGINDYYGTQLKFTDQGSNAVSLIPGKYEIAGYVSLSSSQDVFIDFYLNVNEFQPINGKYVISSSDLKYSGENLGNGTNTYMIDKYVVIPSGVESITMNITGTIVGTMDVLAVLNFIKE